MNTQHRGIAWLGARLAALGLAGYLAACGGSSGGYGGTTPPSTGTGTAYSAVNLVSDASPPAAYSDSNVKNAWGLAFNPAGFVWVADNATSKSTLYDGNGVPRSLVVSIPAGQSGSANPTGIVFNSSQDFKVSQGAASGASAFIFVGEAGTVSGWSPAANATAAITVADGGASGKVYKGAALASYAGANYLYAADFHHNAIDIFDRNFVQVSLPGGFNNPAVPAGYAPYGIQAIGNLIYVSYAKQDAQAHDEIKGSGLGILAVFDSGGYFVKQLAAGGALNAPWGIALAPANFGPFSNDLLVSNFGDGKINAYDPVSGGFAGTLSKSDGTPIVIDGLWGIAFGNGINAQPANTLFFTAGPDDEAHGLYGRIDLR